MKVLVSDNLAEKGIAVLRRTPGLQVDVKTGMSADELISRIGEYDALLIRSATRVSADVIAAADNLKVIGRAGVGVDNVDLAAASRRGVIVMNTPGGNTITTAEHTLSLLTSLARNIPQADDSLRRGRWDRKRYQGVELSGKVLGIIGLGRIGKEIAGRAQAMGMQVVAYDPLLSLEEARKLGVELLSLEQLYPLADFITVHTPLTEETRHLIDRRSIAKMKQGVRIINCARGGIVHERALYEAIVEGRVAGAALDVFEQEPPASDNPLLGLEQVICTPHLGASTAEAQEKVAVAVARQVADFLTRGVISNALNMPMLPPKAQAMLNPYLVLARKLGSLLGQLLRAGVQVREFQAGLAGEQLLQHAGVIANEMLAGFLSGMLPGRKVNAVNAASLAGEVGLSLLPPKPLLETNYTQQLSLEIATARGPRSAAATLLSGKLPRIITLDGFKAEFEPAGYILVLFNEDKPGIIGNIGTILGEQRINIADMQFGRSSSRDKAISIFRTDSPVPERLLPRMEKLPHIHSVQQVLL